MPDLLQKCKECQKYALANSESECPYCKGQLINPRPPKFSLTDKYAKYRREYFKEEFEKKYSSTMKQDNKQKA